LPPLDEGPFPRELSMPPWSWVERIFTMQRWTEMPRDGHFAAMEAPQELAQEVRTFFRPLRRR
jgi:pimeloyl-ACP methyl ester carboxylesterase